MYTYMHAGSGFSVPPPPHMVWSPRVPCKNTWFQWVFLATELLQRQSPPEELQREIHHSRWWPSHGNPTRESLLVHKRYWYLQNDPHASNDYHNPTNHVKHYLFGSKCATSIYTSSVCAAFERQFEYKPLITYPINKETHQAMNQSNNPHCCS